MRARNVFDRRGNFCLACRLGSRWSLHRLLALRFLPSLFDSNLTTNYSISCSGKEQLTPDVRWQVEISWLR